jgi:hypothetical protein
VLALALCLRSTAAGSDVCFCRYYPAGALRGSG